MVAGATWAAQGSMPWVCCGLGRTETVCAGLVGCRVGPAGPCRPAPPCRAGSERIPAGSRPGRAVRGHWGGGAGGLGRRGAGLGAGQLGQAARVQAGRLAASAPPCSRLVFLACRSGGESLRRLQVRDGAQRGVGAGQQGARGREWSDLFACLKRAHEAMEGEEDDSENESPQPRAIHQWRPRVLRSDSEGE